MFLVIIHDPDFQFGVLVRHKLVGRQVGVIGIVLDHVITTFS